MADPLICRIVRRGAKGYIRQLSFGGGQTFVRPISDAELVELRNFDFGSAQTESIAANVYSILFGGAEPLLDDVIAEATRGTERLAKVQLEIRDRALDYYPWEVATLGQAAAGTLEIVRSIPVEPRIATEHPTLPLRVLVGNMGAPHEDTRTYPLRTVLLNIFGDAERLTKVFHPSTMAGVDRDELKGVLTNSRYDIVHLQVVTDWLHGEARGSRGMVAAPGEGPPLVARTLLPLLRRAHTRLLILHLRHQPYQPPAAAQLMELARSIVEGGGPAVLVMPFDRPDPAGGTVLLNRLYDQIVHDQPLDAALHQARLATGIQSATLADELVAAQPALMLGQGAENLLRVSPLANDLLVQTDQSRNRVSHFSQKIDRLSSYPGLDLDLSATRNALASATYKFDQADQIARDITDWSSESRGLMPLHDATQAASGGQRDLQGVESIIEQAEERSARVVNASFMWHGEHIPGGETLLYGREYQFRLQIGKPWGRLSIVRDAPELPERYLGSHSDDSGLDLDVCIFADDFTVTSKVHVLRLPRAPAESEPLDIVVQPNTRGTSRLRVCLYYQQNLVQSLAVVADVTYGKTEKRKDGNYAEVEFSMADTLLGVEELPPRTLNLLTNDSGDGTHKIAIRGADINLQYTVTGSTAIADVRKALLAICADLDKDGKPIRYHYSDSDNSGDEAKLIRDLKELATLGYQLYTDLIVDPANWDKTNPLEDKLKKPGQIQISITKSARNVYPWALLYDRKLESGPGVDVCPVMLKKLTGADQAAKLYSNSCIDGGCPHASNLKIVCPLGFWGFRHAVEQLPPNKGKVVKEIPAQRSPSFVMAVHQKLAGKNHRVEIEKTTGLTAQYVDLKATISSTLKSAKPHIVYFYCHGGRSANAPWLGVGNNEQIAPTDFPAWGTRWTDSTPIVVINGCHTVDLKPDDLLDFVKVLAWCQAAGVIGTEIAIPESLAQEFGRFFIGRFSKGEKVADILRDFRLTMLAKRNVLGLSYTPYCDGDLRLT